MSITIKLRGDTAANWAAENPVLAVREVGLDLTNLDFRVGDGGSAWSALADWISAGAGVAFAIIEDRKDAADSGGDFIAGSYRTRDLNYIAHNDIGASLAANQITLPAGTYFIFAAAPAYMVNRHNARLYNISDSAPALFSQSDFARDTGEVQTSALVVGVIEIVSETTFELQHESQISKTTNGFGVNTSTSLESDLSIFSRVAIARL